MGINRRPRLRYVVIIGMPLLIACSEPSPPVAGTTTPASMNTPIPIPEGPLHEATFDAATGWWNPPRSAIAALPLPSDGSSGRLSPASGLTWQNDGELKSFRSRGRVRQ